LFALLDAERAHVYSLVLASAGIPHAIHYIGAHWQIHVANGLRQQAQEAVALYLLENPIESKTSASPDHPGVRTYSAVFAALILCAVHFAVGSDSYRQAFIASFGADARRIMGGEVYRCVTALMLHADSFHLLGNIAGTLLFGTYAAILYGWGVGWLLILLTGIQGNFLTAWWYGHSHMAIGASTAVFGALGLCAAMTFWRQRSDRAGRWKPWLPIAAALALLGWLGTAPQADFLAHLLGFGSGLFYGSLYEKSVGRVLAWPSQAACLALVALIVSGSWVWGLFYSV
jgi:rhomboid protease GluP